MLQGVAIGRKEEIEQSIDLRVDDIPNDETYKDEQYMQRIAEQVQKLVTTKDFFLKYASPKDNILREQAVKQIHEAGNCDLHEIQQRTHKVQCQRCFSYIEAGFQVCPCGEKLNMSEEMLSGIRQKFQQLIADAYMTFQGTRGARHGAQPWQKHHFIAKEFLRRIHKMGMFSSILVRFQNDEVFHASQLQQNWKNGANIWITSDQIDISHNASLEQLERYAALCHFRYDPKQMERGPMKKSSRLS